MALSKRIHLNSFPICLLRDNRKSLLKPKSSSLVCNTTGLLHLSPTVPTSRKVTCKLVKALLYDTYFPIPTSDSSNLQSAYADFTCSRWVSSAGPFPDNPGQVPTTPTSSMLRLPYVQSTASLVSFNLVPAGVRCFPALLTPSSTSVTT
jgi:hypothetical protein